MTKIEAYNRLRNLCDKHWEKGISGDTAEAITIAIKALKSEIEKSDKIDTETGLCKYYSEQYQEKSTTAFEQGLEFAKTGKISDKKLVITGRCSGQKNWPCTDCKGFRDRCECK